MEEPLANSTNRKCDELATAINAWMQNMTIRATAGQGIKDWMDIGVLGYRTDQQANPIIETAFSLGELRDLLVQQDRTLASVAEIGLRPARMEPRTQLVPDQETGETIQMTTQVPVWVDPRAEGGTPMCHTLHHAYGVLEKWIAEHPRSFPPLLINVTDGESQDGDPIPYAEAITSLCTEDGKVLIFNCHLSMTAADPFMFPSSDAILPEEHARALYKMSSVLPDPIFRRALAAGFQLQPGARGMAFNADKVCLIKFLDMGTWIAKDLR
jgi:hypothetical protein